MNKIRILSLIMSLSLLVSLIACNNRYAIDQQFCDNEEKRAEEYLSQASEILASYYPNCQLKESSFNEKSRENGFYYYANYYTSVSGDTIISIELISDFKLKRKDRFYSVKMEREFDDMTHNGFNSRNLDLFCELSNIVYKNGIKITTCDSLIKDKKYSVNHDGDSFVPIDNYITTFSSHDLYYKVIDYKAGKWENRNYCETLESVFAIK